MSMTRTKLVVRTGAAAAVGRRRRGVRRGSDGRVRRAAAVRSRGVPEARDARPSPCSVRGATTATSKGSCSTGSGSSRRTCGARASCSSRTSSSSSRARRSTPTRGWWWPPRTRSGGSVPRSVVVAEGPGHRRDTEAIAFASGLRDALDDAGLRFVDLNDAPLVRTPLETRYTGLRELWVPRILRETEVVVSMPKLKTHHWVGVTMSLKNCFGCMPGRVYGWPKDVFHVRGIPESILDIFAAVRPSLAIVDGIVGMQGDGPIMGDPGQLGRRRRLARPRRRGRHGRAPDGDGPGEGRLPDGGRPLPRAGALGADRAAGRGSRERSRSSSGPRRGSSTSSPDESGRDGQLSDSFRRLGGLRSWATRRTDERSLPRPQVAIAPDGTVVCASARRPFCGSKLSVSVPDRRQHEGRASDNQDQRRLPGGPVAGPRAEPEQRGKEPDEGETRAVQRDRREQKQERMQPDDR